MPRIVKNSKRRQNAATNLRTNAKKATARELPDTALMLQVARLFYKEHQSQGEIAVTNGIHIKTVRSLLREAERVGIVRIDVCEPPGKEIEKLEAEVLTRFRHLKKVKIIPGGPVATEAEYAALLRQWGAEAATYVDALADKGQALNIGLSGGETILEAMIQLPDRARENVHFYAVALVGRGLLPMSAAHVDPAINATVGWARSGRLPGHCHYATVPPYDSSLGTRRAISEELDRLARRKPIERVIREMDDVNVVFAGLGVVNPNGNNPAYTPSHVNRITMTSLIKPLGITPQQLADQGAVGDIAYCLFNADGQEQPIDPQGRKLSKEEWHFFLTAGHFDPKRQGIEFYRQMVRDAEDGPKKILIDEDDSEIGAYLAREGKKIIVIAGAYKESAILIALKNKLFNVWFTNEDAARKILAMK